MLYIHDTTDISLKNTCVTVGKFDGLHRGHQVLLDILKEYEHKGYTSVMFTFDYLPYNVVSKKVVHQIYSSEEKLALLKKNGPQIIVSYPFTKETADMEPEKFISEILIKKLDMKIIAAGEDFRFGRNRTGDVELLKKYSEKYDYKTVICKKLTIDGNIVSSTRIRSELEKGNQEYAGFLLGREYFGIQDNQNI